MTPRGCMTVAITPDGKTASGVRGMADAGRPRTGGSETSPIKADADPAKASSTASARNGLALVRFSVIYATPPCVITPRSPVQTSCAVLEHLWLTRPYVPKARTLGPGRVRLCARAGFRPRQTEADDLPRRGRCPVLPHRRPGPCAQPVARHNPQVGGRRHPPKSNVRPEGGGGGTRR
jgi:hypothetical protein